MGWIDKIMSSAGDIVKGSNDLVTGKGTTRLKEDNASDSWLTQSIRPIITIWVLGLTTYVLFATGVPVNTQTLVLALLSDIVTFYFVARTTEKVIDKIIKALTAKYK